jgi:hypothetical protein
MQEINRHNLKEVVGGHGSTLLAGEPNTFTLFAVALFIYEAPHVLMHWKEMINWGTNLYEGGCENVDPNDKVGQYFVCPSK